MSTKRARAAQPLQVHWAKRIDNSRLVRQRDPHFLRETATLVGGASVCLAILLLCAWQHFAYVSAGYRLEELRARQEQVREWNRALRLESAALADPLRIDQLARAELGMDAPQAGQLILLGPGEAPVGMPVVARMPVRTDDAATPRPARDTRVSLAD